MTKLLLPAPPNEYVRAISYPQRNLDSIFSTLLELKEMAELYGGLRDKAIGRLALWEELFTLRKELLAALAGSGEVIFVTSNITLTSEHDGKVLLVDCTAGAVFVDFPVAGANKGMSVKVVKIDASANFVTLRATGSDTIIGSATRNITFQYHACEVVSDGASVWYLTVPMQAIGSDVLGGTNAFKTVTPDALASLWENGPNVASAATTTLGEGGYFNITGAVAISSMGFTVEKAGRAAWVRFISSPAPLLTNSGTFNMPGGTGHQAQPGDFMLVVSNGAGTGVRVVCYFNADGSPYDGFASTTDALTGTNARKTVTSDALAATWEWGTTTPAAPLLTINEGGIGYVLGGGTFTDIDFAVPKDGRKFWLVPNASMTLTHSATLNCPGSVDLTVPTGSAVEVVQESGDSIRVLTVLRASGAPTHDYASTTDVLTGTDTRETVTPDALAALWERGTDVASASSLVLPDGGFFNVTGTTGITAISFATPHNGRMAWLSFQGILTLTHGANLILPGGGVITTVAGDQALVVDVNGTQRRVQVYVRADGTILPAGLASTTDVLTGTNILKAVTSDALAALWEYGGIVATAATVSFGEGGSFILNGAGTVSDIDFATPKDGRMAWIFLNSAITFTNSATLNCWGGVDFVGVAGDTVLAWQFSGDTVWLLNATRRNGKPIIAPAYTELTGGGATDNTVPRFNGTTGALQTSGFTVDDSNNISAFGGNIVFPATQAASAGANTLDDYEEGTFTPAITFGGAAVGMTFAAQTGTYTKIGRLVTFTCRVALSAKGSSTGAALVTALPFAAANARFPISVRIGNMAATVGDTHLSASVTPSATTIDIYKATSGTIVALADGDFTATSDVGFGGIYHV